jgi:plasmid replication initiation protein
VAWRKPYQEGRKAADGLLHRVVEVLEDGGEQTKFQWTTLSAYIPAHKHRAGVACVRIRFNEELSPFLLQLRDRYNQIPLTHMLPMPSYNSQRLYEILWHDSHAGSKTL